MLKKISLVCILLCTMLFSWAWLDYADFIEAPLVTETSISLDIEKGSSFNKILSKLKQQDIIFNKLWFKLLAYDAGLTQQLKAGEYDLPVGLTPNDFLLLLSKGKVKQYSITFPEGISFKEMRDVLQQHDAIQQSIAQLSDKEVLQKIDSEAQHPEGLFFPDTYQFIKHTADIAILARAYKKMQSVLKEQWQNKADEIHLKSAYEALILASIVEKETAVASERPIIAGVFTRRLKIGMRLQTDPTVIYGMGENYHGNIRRKDLQTLTAYNTYKINGLPPTPIAMPGKEAIHAALHPAEGNSLYFVANGDGSHIFSATLRQHNNAVNNYQRKRR